MKAAREMAEKKAERGREAKWAKEQEDLRTPEERARDEEEADALHERLRRETPLAQHSEPTVNETNGAPYYCRRSTPCWRTLRGSTTTTRWCLWWTRTSTSRQTY